MGAIGIEGVRALGAAVAALAAAEDEGAVVAALLAHGRAIADADGIAVARREGDEVRYLGEDSIAPLWSGRSFPIEAVLSGTAMLQNRTILVPDIFDDLRVPLATYAPTFVRSLVLLPLGAVRPHLALGAYWAEARPIERGVMERLAQLKGAVRLALERVHGGVVVRRRSAA